MLSIDVSGLADLLGIFYYVLVYGIGVVALTLSTLAVQFKRRVTIIVVHFVGQSFWTIHFILQGDLSSAITCAISAIMLAVFSLKDKYKWAVSPLTITLFLVATTGFALVSFRIWSDIFPLLAGIFCVIANSRTTEKRLRQFAFFWSVSWLLNSITKIYPVAFVSDLFATISTVVALIRYRERRKV